MENQHRFCSQDPGAVSTSPSIREDLETTLPLGRLLSPQSQSPTTPLKSREEAPSSSVPFRCIGFGTCGIVYARDGESTVVKLAKRGFRQDLLNDSTMHQRIKKQFDLHSIKNVKVPDWISFEPSTDSPTFFDRHAALESAVGNNCEIPTSALVTERIQPLPEPTRLALIDRYCPEAVKQAAIDSPGNRDCLVRVYLGSMKGRLGSLQPGAGGRPLRWFTLRNLALHLNQMEHLNMDVGDLARRIGTAMAVMHWAAKTDARDVEFVLGSSSRKLPSAGNVCLCTTNLWLLDFNQVQSITMDEAGVNKAVEAARINDPYIPRPRPGEPSVIEKRAWNGFVEGYLAQADAILNSASCTPEQLALPRMFIRRLGHGRKD